MRVHDVLIGPKVTEKSVQSVNTTNVATFLVHPGSNKDQIAAAIESAYDVKVAAVRTTTRKGKSKRRGKKGRYVQLSDQKIAYITLKSGTINAFPSAV